MKLLFDENLSPKLPQLLVAYFPDSLHVRDCQLKGAADEEIWEYARSQDFVIVSKDSDFHQRSLFYGSPPKFIWLRLGNCTRAQVITLLIARRPEICLFAANPSESVLVLS